MNLAPDERPRLWRLFGTLASYAIIFPHLYPEIGPSILGLFAVAMATSIGYNVGNIQARQDHIRTLEQFRKYIRHQRRLKETDGYPLDPRDYEE